MEFRKAAGLLPLVRTGAAMSTEECGPSSTEDQLLRATLRDIRETLVLLRALSWVDSASQDVRVARYIEKSAASIHPVIDVRLGQDPSDYDTHLVRSVTDWSLFTSIQTNIQGGHPPHQVLTAKAPDASRTFVDIIHDVEAPPMPMSFVQKLLFAVSQ